MTLSIFLFYNVAVSYLRSRDSVLDYHHQLISLIGAIFIINILE